MKKKKLSGMLTLLTGAGLGMLFAPKKGKDLREDIKNEMKKFYKKIKKIDISEIKEDLEETLNKIEKEFENLDKEKIKTKRKQKITAIKKDLDELIKIAKNKKNQIIEDAASELKEKLLNILE